MTLQQGLSFGVIAVMMGAFIWGRIRYDLVAASALLVAIAVGIVPWDAAFSGFSDDIVIIVGSALIVSGAVARSGVMEAVLARFAPNITVPRLQLLILVATVATLSAFVKNIGALAIMIPVAFQMARRSSVPVSMFLMPMSFAALLGGLITQIGTSPNIIVSRVRQDLTGTSFEMFDFAVTGIALSVAGVVFLTLFYWLLPVRERQGIDLEQVIEIKNYTTEGRVRESSPLADKTVSDLHRLADNRVMVTAIVTEGEKRRVPFPDAVLRVGDRVLMQGEPEALDKAIELGGLELKQRPEGPELIAVEAIVGPSSVLAGTTAHDFHLGQRTNLLLLAVSRRDKRFTERLSHITLEPGDVVVIQGSRALMGESLRYLDLLPLAERKLRLGTVRNRLLPVLILAAAMVASATGLVPVAIAFFAAAVLIVVTRTIPLREVYADLDGPILLMLAALIPVSDSLRTTGATDLIAAGLSSLAMGLPAFAAIGLILVAAMAVTPFLNNAATVLVMAPIAATFAGQLGLRPEAFLMAVAIGAGCDFLTPIGHQCNTLVMGPGGYRFGDYWRLGLPLSVVVVVISVILLPIVWPLT